MRIPGPQWNARRAGTTADHPGEDEDGGRVSSPAHGLDVPVDDNCASLGLRPSRAEAQDLRRSLVDWLAATAGTGSHCLVAPDPSARAAVPLTCHRRQCVHETTEELRAATLACQALVTRAVRGGAG